MHDFSFSRLGNHALLRKLTEAVAQHRASLVTVLALIAEVDARKLFAPLGYTSMFAYCVEALRFSEDAAYRRIRVARVARAFPRLWQMLADGRLHLTAVLLLKPHLSSDNAAELFAAAEGKGKSEIERWLATRFPAPDLAERVRAIPVRRPAQTRDQSAASGSELALAPVEAQAEPTVATQASATPAKLRPLAPKRFALQTTVNQMTHDKLRYAQELMSHQLPSGDIAQVLDLALDALIAKLEKRKFAATSKPRASARRAGAQRTIPARIKRAVWARDGGRCTFVGENGHTCGARKFLEFDHADPVALGGEATVATIRLRCRAHNQLEAERALGASFMQDKREARDQSRSCERSSQSDRDVMAALRNLGYRAREARAAADFSRDLADGPLDDRVRSALSYLRPRSTVRRVAVRRRAA